MTRSLLVLLLAILLPSLVLGSLALRSVREQQIVLERRTAELCQARTDTVATAARSLLGAERRAFTETLHQMLAEESPAQLQTHFAARLHQRWARPALGFALAADGRVLAPTASEAAGNADVRQFLADNSAFLGGKTTATTYLVPGGELDRPELSQQRLSKSNTDFQKRAPSIFNNRAAAPERSDQRNVSPVQQGANKADSQLAWAAADFRALSAGSSEGVVSRFVRGQLNLIFWVRPAEAPTLVFGCLLLADDLKTQWPALLQEAAPDGDRAAGEPEFILALLNDQALPAAVAPAGSMVAEWKKPFVATEIGESLPHWEAALYLRHPEQLAATARQTRLRLCWLIGCALGAIALGGSAVLLDTRRQLRLAQQKTDFVSNVSHELKTPLTSIRMFAELMHTGRAEAERRPEYLRIIMVEAERLTRLINNVLDFARRERREARHEPVPLDLRVVVAETWALHAAHLREDGFRTEWQDEAGCLPVLGEADALAQVLVNLLSNAEKYGGERKEIVLHTGVEGTWVCLSVLDRGPGVPRGEEAKIFQPFFRAHDSLSSGIPGTGLGLSLARHTVQVHGGELTCRARAGGGSAFILRLPLRSEDA